MESETQNLMFFMITLTITIYCKQHFLFYIVPQSRDHLPQIQTTTTPNH